MVKPFEIRENVTKIALTCFAAVGIVGIFKEGFNFFNIAFTIIGLISATFTVFEAISDRKIRFPTIVFLVFLVLVTLYAFLTLSNLVTFDPVFIIDLYIASIILGGVAVAIKSLSCKFGGVSD
jgi:hypothetical protein